MEASLSFEDKTNSIRKLRKKLRQIEKLERLERELTIEEERKVNSEEDIRTELQELVKEQESNMVSLTVTKTDDGERTAVEDELASGKKLDEINAFDANNLDGHHLGMLNPTSHLSQFNGHHMISSEEMNGHSINGHALNGHELNGHAFNGHAFNGHSLNGHSIADQHSVASHYSSHHLASHLMGGAGGLSLGFSDDGQIIADLPSTDEQKVSIPENALVDKSIGHEINITKSSLRSKSTKSTIKVDSLSLFQGLTFKMQLFEGHHQETCAIDISGDYVISGGRDTSLKFWLASTQEELKSLGGHSGTITGVKFLKDKQFASFPDAITSSYDCSLKVWNLEKGKIERSIYVYSPVCCLDYAEGIACIGTEGGKIELYNVDTGAQEFTVKAHEDQVTAVKILTDGKIASGSTDGILKVHDPQASDQSEPYYMLDSSKVSVKQAVESEVDVTQVKTSLIPTKITCIEAYKDLIVYGDEGYNIKVLDHKKGEVVKIRNNLKEFSPTEALYIARVQGRDFLFCVGSDVDNGDGFTNVRSLPDLRYMGTIRDPNVNSGAITSFCLEEVNNRIRFITCGAQLRTWDQIQTPARRNRKRKNSNEEEEPYVPCKFVCTYTVPRESDPESENDSESESSSSTDCVKEQQLGREPARSWCTIL